MVNLPSQAGIGRIESARSFETAYHLTIPRAKKLEMVNADTLLYAVNNVGERKRSSFVEIEGFQIQVHSVLSQDLFFDRAET